MKWSIAGGLLSGLLVSTNVCAQGPGTELPSVRPETWRAGDICAPRKALEVTVNAGFTQPTGPASRGRAIQDIIGPGAEFAFSVGYRATPSWSFELFTQLHASEPGRQAALRGADGLATLAGATWHALPYELVDPHVSLATGVRVFRERSGLGLVGPLTSGLDLARVQAGLEVRATKSVALSLYAAMDLNLFLWSERQSSFGSGVSRDPGVGTFLSGGLMGRFDMGGIREKAPRRAE